MDRYNAWNFTSILCHCWNHLLSNLSLCDDKIGFSVNQLRLVHLTWIDSSTSHGWEELHSIDDAFNEIHTFGLLVDSDPVRYVVASSYDHESASVNGVIQIPTCCVQKVEILQCLTMT